MVQIYSAINDGNLDTLTTLLKSSIHVKQLGWEAWNQWQAEWEQHPVEEITPLERAARLGDVKIIHLLLEASIKLSDFRLPLDRAIRLACEAANIELVRIFLETKAKIGHVKGTSFMKDSSFIEAAIIGRCTEIIKLLIEFGFDPNGVENGFTPLMAAANTNNLEAAKILVEAGANVNQTDGSRWKTALIQAAYYGHLEVYDFLKPMSDEQSKQIAKDNFGRYAVNG